MNRLRTEQERAGAEQEQEQDVAWRCSFSPSLVTRTLQRPFAFVRSFVRSLGPSGNWQQRSRSVSNNLATERQTGNKTLTSFGSRPTTTRRRGKKERDCPREATATAEETDKTRSLLLRYLSIFAPLKNRQLGRPPPLPPPSSLLSSHRCLLRGNWPTAAAEETGESQNLGIKLFTVQSGYNETDHNI